MNKRFSHFGARKFILMLADAGLLVVSALVADLIITLVYGNGVSMRNLFASSGIVILSSFAFLSVLGVYNRLWRDFSLTDYIRCALGIILGFALEFLLVYFINKGEIPTKFYSIHCLISVVAVCTFRFAFKKSFVILVETGRRYANSKKTMIIGAGTACEMIISEIMSARQRDENNRLTMFDPICIVDDNTRKVGAKLLGIPIVGTTTQIPKIVTAMKIEQILFAIPSCPDISRQRIFDICSNTGVPLKTVPFIGDLICGADQPDILNRIRDINMEDLLGRKPVKLDNANIKSFVQGKVCLVTGGGGSIGSEIVRQLAHYSPKQLIIVDIYENNAYDIQQELNMEYGASLDHVALIASVRDYARMDAIFLKYKPDIVFHAAAHKHVPLMENSPVEAIKNNVFGTYNVASIAQKHKTKKFVMISTDKAVNPTNVMGASKRLCEMIVQYLSQAQNSRTDFVTTRFGNVLGSNGSVIPLFKRQIEQGKPITVTHPDIIRYFMTIPEAVNLVLEASVMAKGGEIFVLDMGKPVRIVSLAENLIRMYGKRPYIDVQIVFTGLRPGEKIKEELLMDEEGLTKTSNELIFIGKHTEIDEARFTRSLEQLKCVAENNDSEEVLRLLREMVPTFVDADEFNKKELSTV